MVTGLNSLSLAIRCYQCGSEAVFIHYNEAETPKSKLEKLEDTALTLQSCANLEYSFSSWGMYSVDCGEGQICMKTVIDDGFDETGKHHYFTSSRGCAMRNTSFGKIHPLQCGILATNLIPPADMTQNRKNLVCFCESDYCNSSTSVFVAFPVLGFCLIIYSGAKFYY
ncbi:unnamed protein product [Orchesella dallaii]|uniref:Protein sleepless n=1 Tax=Orchesella dallaii TaxID=48710 RepID=A0ABP1QNR8_9HEXA